GAADVRDISMSTNPASFIVPTYSSMWLAPPTHATHDETLSRTASGNGPVRQMSDTASLPPGLRTRNASLNTAALSSLRLMTQLEITMSTLSETTGSTSM